MEEIFINPENGQVGKYPIKLHISTGKNSENSLLSIGFYLDFFSKNSEISYIKKILKKELKERDFDEFNSYFFISSNNLYISEIFKCTQFSYERIMNILSVFSLYLLELDLKGLSEVININREKDIVRIIINLVCGNDSCKKPLFDTKGTLFVTVSFYDK